MLQATCTVAKYTSARDGMTKPVKVIVTVAKIQKTEYRNKSVMGGGTQCRQSMHEALHHTSPKLAHVTDL